MKRKNEAKLPQTVTKSSKIEAARETKKKPLTKPELMVEFKALQVKHEHLLEENHKNLEMIEQLRRDLIQKKEITANNVKKVEVSTETDECNQQCNECEYPANDMYELGEHIYEFHTIKTHGKFVCTFCDEKFGSKDDMMLHRKLVHKGRVRECRNF